MNLYLSRLTHINSVYMLESGQVLYKVVTPMGLTSRTSTVYKVVPSDQGVPRYDDFDPNTWTGSEEEDTQFLQLNDDAFKDKFAIIGSVEHKAIGSSLLTFSDKTVEASSYFKKDGYHYHGYHRVFTGPDGREYKWRMKATHCHLYLNDKAQTSIAKYHRKSFGIFGKKHPAYLEISDEGLNILDTILITFIYIEKKLEDD